MSPPSSERPPRTPDQHPERARDGSPRVPAAPKTEFEFAPPLLDLRTTEALPTVSSSSAPRATRPLYVAEAKSADATPSVATSRAQPVDGGGSLPARPLDLASFVTTMPWATEPNAELQSVFARAEPVSSVRLSPSLQPSPQPSSQPSLQPSLQPDPKPHPQPSLQSSYAPPPAEALAAPIAPPRVMLDSKPAAENYAQLRPAVSGPAARPTDPVDVRIFARDHVPLPELGKNAEDSSSRWLTNSDTAPQERVPVGRPASPSKPAPAYKSRNARRRAPDEDGEADEAFALERSLQPPAARKVLLFGACAVALAVLGASFLRKPEPQPMQVAVAQSAASVVAPTGAPVPAPSAPLSAPVPALERVADAPAPAAPAAPPAPHARVERGDRVERGGATPESAAALYMKGQYKEALAEYRLLANAHPEQTVYAEFARVLKRKLFDTCVRTQPNRREQCKQL